MLDIRVLETAELMTALSDLADLRIMVFRDWPYLYEGDRAYDSRYLEPYRATRGAVIVGAFDGNCLVGAATGMPLLEHADGFSSAFSQSAIDARDVFYCAESVLLPRYRGQGAGHVFFDLREAAARASGYRISAFCAVTRAASHPRYPEGYRPLDPFWRARGYAPVPGVVASLDWKDIGDTACSSKELQFWSRTL